MWSRYLEVITTREPPGNGTDFEAGQVEERFEQFLPTSAQFPVFFQRFKMASESEKSRKTRKFSCFFGSVKAQKRLRRRFWPLQNSRYKPNFKFQAPVRVPATCPEHFLSHPRGHMGHHKTPNFTKNTKSLY